MTISTENEIWPNFFIVGAMKAGTTSLYTYLKEIKDIYMSPIKEPNYFASSEIPFNSFRKVVRDKKQYLSLFKGAEKAIAIGEASTDYLYSQNAPYLIQKSIPNAKIIIILRDPIDRAFSHYLSNVRYKQFNIHNLTFLEAVYKDYMRSDKGIGVSLLYIEYGLYFEKLKCYIDLFGKENVSVIFFEEFIINTSDHVKNILRFLNIESQVPKNINNIYNSYFKPKNNFGKFIVSNRNLMSLTRFIPTTIKQKLRNSLFVDSSSKPSIPSEARNYLYHHYQEDVNNIRRLLNRDLPWNNFK